MGGENITSDLALLLRVGIDEAELLKRGEAALSKNKKNAEIIESRIEFLSEKINQKLESINRKELLSGGAVLTGETSKLKNIENTIRYSLKIPARVLEWKLHGNEYVRCYGTTLMYDSLQEVSLYQKLIGNSIDRFVMFIKKFLP
jgi:cell division ATPase FtsA